MIPRSQHFRDRAPFPHCGPGIVRILKEAVLERLFSPTGSRAHYAGKQPNASIEEHERGRLPTRKHDIADGDFLHGPACEDAFIETFETAAQQDDAGAVRKLADAGLREGLSARGERDDGAFLDLSGQNLPVPRRFSRA